MDTLHEAKKHLLLFLGQTSLTRFDGLLEQALSPDRAYLGLVDRPDLVEEVRANVVSTIQERQDNFFRSRVERQLQVLYKNHPRPTVGDVRELVSPFAAVVFDRCNGDRRRLAKEIQRLREELTPTRIRLRDLEWEAFFGNYETSIRAENKIDNELRELAHDFKSPGFLSCRRRKGLSVLLDVAKGPAINKCPFSGVEAPVWQGARTE